MTGEKQSIEIITPAFPKEEYSDDVTFIRGYERIETTWSKLFAVEAMYAACKTLVSMGATDFDIGIVQEAFVMAENAIEKAKGES